MSHEQRARGLMPWLGLSCLTSIAVSAAPPTVSHAALARCAAIDGANERLNCYDELAGRAHVSSDQLTPVPAPTAGETPPTTAFGLYSAEHPAQTKTPAEHATVVSFGRSPNGRPTVVLDGGQVWEMDSADPLLSPGDAVTVTRATLGSFMMSTPGGRSHRLRRLH